jgi:hypothetical protein
MKKLFNVTISMQNTEEIFIFSSEEMIELRKKYQIAGKHGKSYCDKTITFFSNNKKEVISYVESFLAETKHDNWFGLLYVTEYDSTGTGTGFCNNIAVARNVSKSELIDIISGNKESHEIYQ